MKRWQMWLLLGCVAAGCGGSSPEAGGTPSGSTPGVPGSSGPVTGPAPAPVPIPIKHVVVVVKENHTFDNYFGSFPGAEGTQKCLTSQGLIDCPRAPDVVPRDLCHEHSCALTAWSGGRMDGWDGVDGNSKNGDHLAYAQYREADIPNYWAYARTYALADHFFANMLGPSFPGHLMVLAAQAGWATGNPDTQILHPYWGCDQSKSARVSVLADPGFATEKSVFPCFDIPSVPDVLPAGVDWKFYGSHFYILPEIWSMFDAISPIRNGSGWKQVVEESSFEDDIDHHRLPAVSWLVNQDLAAEHPFVGSICLGENWTVEKINKLMNSEYWKDTVILFTMDDFGGWYDHVPPPRQYGGDADHPYGLGFRLPLIIMSPYVRPHQVFSEVAEQASIPRFIERVFGAPALSTLDQAAQDGQANDLMNAFDFTQVPNPPLVLPQRVCGL